MAVVTFQSAYKAEVHHLDLAGWKLILRQVAARLLFTASGQMKEFAKKIQR